MKELGDGRNRNRLQSSGQVSVALPPEYLGGRVSNSTEETEVSMGNVGGSTTQRVRYPENRIHREAGRLMSLRSRKITSLRVQYPENRIHRERARGRDTKSQDRERSKQPENQR